MRSSIGKKLKRKLAMTEKEFWIFLNRALARGRVPQMSGYINSDDKVVNTAGEYFGGHSVLFEGHDRLDKKIILEMTALVLDSDTTLRAKEAIIMILAHHPSKEALTGLKEYNKNPDKGLEYTAHFALQECEWWNE
jgi:hypothetical protein